MATDWRENRRRDALAKAQVERSRDAARLEADLARRRLDAELRHEAEANSRAQRAQTMRARAERRAAQLAWLREHAIDLVFVPVIVVPGVLAWSAMGAFGEQLFGPVGLGLPAISEGAMWVFEMRNVWVTQHEPDRPTWPLRLGAWFFTAVGAALNFLHGLTATPGSDRPHGLTVGLVMAVVSAAGMAAHQIIKTGPRRTRAQRAAARREDRARRAAIRSAAVGVDADGTARVILEPGTMRLDRKLGRTVLKAIDRPADDGHSDSRVWLPWPRVLPGDQAATVVTVLPDDADIQAALADYLDRHSPGPPVATAGKTDPPDADEIGRQMGTQLALAVANTERMAAIVRPNADTAELQSAARGDVAPDGLQADEEQQADERTADDAASDTAPASRPRPVKRPRACPVDLHARLV
jgi:hypothetical protein